MLIVDRYVEIVDPMDRLKDVVTGGQKIVVV